MNVQNRLRKIHIAMNQLVRDLEENQAPEIEMLFYLKSELRDEAAVAAYLQGKLREVTPYLFALVDYAPENRGTRFSIPFGDGRLEVTTEWIPK